MEGAATASSEVPVAPPASIPEDPTGFLPGFWQGLGLVALYAALGIPSARMNRRALLVLIVAFGGAVAVMAWLRAEMRTAAASQGESAATIPGSRSPPEPRAK